VLQLIGAPVNWLRGNGERSRSWPPEALQRQAFECQAFECQGFKCRHNVLNRYHIRHAGSHFAQDKAIRQDT